LASTHGWKLAALVAVEVGQFRKEAGSRSSTLSGPEGGSSTRAQ